MRSRVLETTIVAAVAGAVWTHVPRDGLRLRRLSLAAESGLAMLTLKDGTEYGFRG